MLEAGALVVAIVALMTLTWYRQASARFSERVVGFDATSPTVDSRGLTRPRVGRELRRAFSQPSSDPETEHWRVVTHRRLRIFLFDGFLLLAVPLVFALIGIVAAVLTGGGWIGYAWLAGIVALLTYWAFRLGLVLFHYGSGRALDWRALGISSGGIGVVVAILVVVVLVRAT